MAAIHPARKVRLAITGRIMQAAGLAMYVLGATAAIGIVAAGHKVSRIRPVGDAVAMAVAVLIAFLLALLLLALAPPTVMFGKRLLAEYRRLTAIEWLEQSDVPIVLYLRPFLVDDPADTPVAYTIKGVGLPRLSTEEEHLARALRHAGHFLAIGRPNENLPPAGALRVPGGPSWKATADSLMRRAEMVIIRVGCTRFLWWEVVKALRTVPRERLVFLVPADDALWQAFRSRMQRSARVTVPEYTVSGSSAVAGSISAILYFERNGTPHINPLPDAGLRASGFQPLRPILRMAFQPVFAQLRLRWTPPPVPLQAIIPVLFLIYGEGLFGFWFLEFEPWHTLRVWEYRTAFDWIGFAFCALLGVGMLWIGLLLWVRLLLLHAATFRFPHPVPAPDE
jgi:hypothetical protein